MKKYLIAYLNSELNNKSETVEYFEKEIPITEGGVIDIGKIEERIAYNKSYTTVITVISISPLFLTLTK